MTRTNEERGGEGAERTTDRPSDRMRGGKRLNLTLRSFKGFDPLDPKGRTSPFFSKMEVAPTGEHSLQ